VAYSTLLLTFCRALDGRTLLQLTCNVRELALLQFGLPEDRVRIVEAMLDPSILLDMVQVDEATRVRVTVRSSQDTSSAKLERLIVLQVVLILCVEHAVGECLTRADTEEVARQTRAVAVDVVESGAFLGSDASAHGALVNVREKRRVERMDLGAYHAQAHALV
jgi:hypothetical protein